MASKLAQHLLRIPQELKDELKTLADNDNRSLNNYLTTILEEHVESLKGASRDTNRTIGEPVKIDLNLPESDN